MDGRVLRRWTVLGLGLVIPAAGCNSLRPRNDLPPGGLPQANAGRSSLLPSFGSTNQKFPGPPPEQAVTKAPRKKGTGLGIEGELAFADTEVDGAFAEGKSAVERDALIDAARQRYQKVLTADPKNKAALVGIGRLYAKAGDRDRAIESYQAALRNHPKDHELAHKLAALHARFADWPGCADAAKYALSHDPENRTYQKTYGYALSQNGKWQEALESLVKVMSEAEARYFLGRVLADLERLDDAKVQMDLALQTDPNFEPAREFLATIQSVNPIGAPVTLPPGTPTPGSPVDPNVVQTGGTQPAPNP